MNSDPAGLGRNWRIRVSAYAPGPAATLRMARPVVLGLDCAWESRGNLKKNPDVGAPHPEVVISGAGAQPVGIFFFF